MKLLFDEHLSSKLTHLLSDIFPHSKHVKDLGLESEKDSKIWSYAKAHGFVIVTKDSDFIDIVNLKASPPYLIWIRSGNVRVKEIERLMRSNAVRILNAFENQRVGIIQIQ